MARGPRRINLVSIAFVLVAIGAIYTAVKFVPAYLKGSKVETILDAARHEAAQIDEFSSPDRADRLVEDVREQVLELGDIPEEKLYVHFDDAMTTLTVDYTVVVEHPFGKTTELEFSRSVEIDRD